MPIAFLSLSGILRILDLAVYDLGFHLRPSEPMDERIVIVEWTEENLQTYEETTFSDENLAALVEKIQAQQPSLIAFDIYRDIPVYSPRLSDEENSQAYKRLQELFRSTPNLFGIEKILEPKINPPKVLKEKEQIAASDLPSDRDGFIRRSYIFPILSKEGEPRDVPYIGSRLAGEYLVRKGLKTDLLDNNSLIFYDDDEQNLVILNPLKNFAGAYNDDRQGLDFLINWRKGETLFRRVSAGEITSNQIPPDLFSDRLVIIGNVSSATGDRHPIPLNRWRRTDKIGTYGVETFGVEIVAQVASSIISAALDGRPLMKPAPKIIEILLFLASVGAIIKFIAKSSYSRKNLYLATLLPALSITGILLLCCFVAHNLGWWLPVAISIASVWVVYLAIIYYLNRKQELDKFLSLDLLAGDLKHRLGNKLHSFKSSSRLIKTSFKKFESILPKDEQEVLEAEENFNKAVLNIDKEVSILTRYNMQLDRFLKYSHLNIIELTNSLDANQTVETIVNRFFAENDDGNPICVLKQYDGKIPTETEISTVVLEIVLNNLLENAVWAVSAKARTAHEYFPTICVKTRLSKNRKIEFIVEDNGIGIRRAYLKEIFQPFESFRSEKSSGLGLYIAKKLVTSYGGTIGVESTLRKGSKFIFSLPLINRNHPRFFDNFLSFLRKE
ncbi:CHASE2 domain-containing protein [Myxosarcina sp. GI1]|uniref:CHASE2 domain-containing protein n=1 Tax=Myxosarcina sp. GI1 TaxID=1541065 RepID=UPI001C0F8E5F|nr:CHASE2 domain-containing protein [Myxosarcina sp. GI1]